MTSNRTTQAGAPAGIWRWCSANRHFSVAVAVLALTWVATAAVGWIVKMPVVWPKGVEVDPSFRLTSLPDTFGSYVKVTEDGVLSPQGKKDGNPDGELVFSEKDLEALGYGNALDEQRYPQRCSGWYVSRIYENKSASPQDPYRYWRLDVCYYTGSRDQVPHVAEICLQAGGASVDTQGKATFDFPHLPQPWQKDVEINRVQYSGLRGSGVDYYLFSCNGKPQTDRLVVRAEMSYPWVRHNYFAKIQFSPLGATANAAESDAAAAAFLSAAMPEVLKLLPTPQDIDRMDQAYTHPDAQRP
ncbi:MAG: hypothetical protein ABFD92_05130 [Planctomycetaceae bacterium]|nr:hypothetical protein [Planctomycetaceae bacterium]